MSLEDMDGGINTTRMLIGGIAAGVVIDVGEMITNLFLFAAEFEALNERLSLPAPGGSTILLFNLLGLALGIGTVWLYAAIRPRFGPGPRTGVCAGLAVWGFFYLLPGIANVLMGLYPTVLFVKAVAVQGIVMTAAGYIGGMFYSE